MTGKELLALLTSSKVLLPIAIILGFTVPNFAIDHSLKPWMLPVLGIVTFFSLRKLQFHNQTVHEWKVSAWLLLVNFIYLSGLYIIFAYFFVPNESYRHALWMIAIMPPAVTIISYAVILKGNLRETLFAESIGFLISFLIAPIAGLLLFKEHLNIWEFLRVFCYTLIIPMVLAVITQIAEKHTKKDLNIFNYLIGPGNALFFYILISYNKALIFSSPNEVVPIVIILVLIKFVFIFGLYFLMRRIFPRMELVNVILFGSLKNFGTAALFATTLWGIQSTLPIAIDGTLFVIQLIVLEIFFTRKCAAEKSYC